MEATDRAPAALRGTLWGLLIAAAGIGAFLAAQWSAPARFADGAAIVGALAALCAMAAVTAVAFFVDGE